jgi:hypothetical protein
VLIVIPLVIFALPTADGLCDDQAERGAPALGNLVRRNRLLISP